MKIAGFWESYIILYNLTVQAWNNKFFMAFDLIGKTNSPIRITTVYSTLQIFQFSK